MSNGTKYPSLKDALDLFSTSDDSLRAEIKAHLKRTKHKFIVLDDDPTGVQTVHDIFVITDWGKDWIEKGLSDERSVLYILTNTRSYNAEKTENINREIVRNIVDVTKEMGIDYSIISRSDSTLRGHYPLEIDVLQDELSKTAHVDISGHLIIPAFFEAHRYTLENTHFLGMDGNLVPVNETEFANDSVFGFTTANLPKWIEEKTNGNVRPGSALIISLEDIHEGGMDRVYDILLSANHNAPIIVNAKSYYELDIVSLAVLKAIDSGKHFLFRTAASFVKSIAGIQDRPYLSANEIVSNEESQKNGGFIIVGSHTNKTTEQVKVLMNEYPIVQIEMNVRKILDEETRTEELTRVCQLVDQNISSNHDTLVYTSRDLISAKDKEENLKISQTVSSSLVQVIRSLKVKPKFIIAKGGITSSDVATEGLEIKYAKILGQAIAGVPVWLTGSEAKFKNTPYIVFPGNVGDKESIAQIFENIKKDQKGEI
ncbi:four-carbon acid sugar kinase family protein [Peribacillus sp. SI8-4]|uniref:four-carbon acid sugar kinase family protein n=1 Tax=Peribacillus sp. SI8-4 TaxID=3048009 RepID=UPI00255752D7|nr:four-carbon acid sugar kinase family protein [Peribacillus sp. SI8-4]